VASAGAIGFVLGAAELELECLKGFNELPSSGFDPSIGNILGLGALSPVWSYRV
jgi:hypothetical protein